MSDFPFDIVCFDLEGTLLETHRDLGTAVNHALTLGGFATVPLDNAATEVDRQHHAVRRRRRIARRQRERHHADDKSRRHHADPGEEIEDDAADDAQDLHSGSRYYRATRGENPR